MKIKLFTITIAFLVCAIASAGQTPQEKEATRNATRDKLRMPLAVSGPKKGIEIDFKQSEKNPWNFVAIKRSGLKNAQSMEIVIGVTDDNTIGFRIYPYYNNSYVNVDKTRNASGLMRLLLNLSYQNFLYWGADATGDVFAGYTFTLESGFPDKAVEIVLYSIAPLDGYVGQLRPFIDGSAAVH